MASEEQLINQVNAAVEKLTGTFQTLQNVLDGNLTQQKQLIDFIGELKKTIGSSKEFKDFAAATAQLTKAQETLSKQQSHAIKIAKESEQLKQQQLKTQKAAKDALIQEERRKKALIATEEAAARQKARVAREAEKATRASRDATSAYQRESARLRELTARAKDAAIQYGVNSRQARALRNEQQQLDRTLKRVDSSLGIHNRNVGNYRDGLRGVTGILGQFGVALGGARIAMNAFNGIIKNSQTAGDAWAATVGEIKGAWEGLFQALGTGEGTLKGIIQSMKDGAAAGREYALAMDDLFEGGEGARIQVARLNRELADLETIRKQAVASRDYERVIAVAEQIGNKELEKLRLIQTENERRFRAEANFIERRTGLNEESFISFLENYREEEQLRDEAIKFRTRQSELERQLLAAENRIRSSYSGQTAEQFNRQKEAEIAAAKERIEAHRDATDEAIIIYNEYLKKWGGTTDEMVKRAVDAYVAIEDSHTASIRQQQRNETALARAREMVNEEGKDGAEDFLSFMEDKSEEELNISNEQFAQELKDRAEADKKHREYVLEFNEFLQKQADEHVRIKAESLQKQFELERQQAERLKELNTEINQQARELGLASVNAVFDRKQRLYEDDLEANRRYFDGLLANELMDEEQRRLLEAQREERENEIREKQRQLERRQFLWNQALAVGEVWKNTAIAITKVKAQLGVLAPPVIAKIKASAAIQTGIIAAQSIPAFDKGTEKTPDTYWISENAPEFHIDKKGNATLIEKPTLMTNDAGSKVISSEKTAKMLDIINDYTAASIINNGNIVTEYDLKTAREVNGLRSEQRKYNEEILRALNKKESFRNTEHDRLRKQSLINKMKY